MRFPSTAALLAVSLICPTSLRADLSWNQARLQEATIYLPPAPEAPAKKRGKPVRPLLNLAADDLQEYLKKMTGAEVKIVEIADAAQIPKGKPAFILGPLATGLGAKPPTTEFGEDGYIITLKDGRLLLAGEDAIGTAFAVADFLGRQGVRWYMPGPYGEEVPQRKDVTIPEAPVIEKPSYEDRVLWYNGGAANKSGPDVGPWFSDWRRRNRTNLGNRISTGHMWVGIFKHAGPEKAAKANREAVFKTNPELFGIVKGERKMGQLNLMNEEVVDLFVTYYRKLLEGSPSDVRRILSASPDDGLLVNENPGSEKFVTQRDLTFSNLPDSTDLLIQFLNRVITKVNQEYPNVKLAFYIYSNYQNGPTNVELNKNLIPFIAPLNFSRYHAVNDATKPSRTLLATIVKRWHASNATFGWRDYSFLCPDAMMPFTRLHITPREIPWLYEQGCRYYNTETNINWPNLLPEYYLLTQMLWDVKTDKASVLKEFYPRFFGAAAESMKAYVDELTATYDSLPFSSGNKEFVATTFTPERSAKLRSLMETAKAAVANDETRTHRIKLIETALNQAERFMKMRTEVNAFDYAKAQETNLAIQQAFDDDKAFDPHTNSNFVKDVWYHRFYGGPVAQMAEWLEGAEVLHVFPDEWPAHFDMTSTGELEELFNPGSTAFDFMKLKTYSRSLGEQGWEKFRGDIWYRQTFPKVKIPAGKKAYLVFGGVASTAKVWINGKPAGEGKVRDFAPLLLPIEDFEMQESNTLTLKVSNRAIVELGVGGLIRPMALIVK